MFKRIRSYVIFSLLALPSLTITAQKKVLDHTVYDDWKSLTGVSISDDGQYGAAVVNAQEGDGYLLLRNLLNDRELKITRAYKFTFVPDQQHLVAQIKAPFAVTRQAKIKKVAAEKMPKDSLVIISLADFKQTKIANIKDYKVAKEQSKYLAYRLDDSLKVNKNEVKAYQLVVRQLQTGKEDSIKSVTEYLFDDNGAFLTANIKAVRKDSLSKNQIIVCDLLKQTTDTISRGKTIYKQLSISETGKHVAFFATSDSLKKEIKDYGLYSYINREVRGDSAQLVVNKQTQGMPADWSISEHYRPLFSKAEKRLLLKTAPIPLPKDTLTPAFEKATLDIWHWSASETPPQQLVNVDKKLKENFLAYVDLESGKFYQLGTEEIPSVTITDENDGRYAIGVSTLPYKLETQWDAIANYSKDIWVFDLVNNTNKKVKTALVGNIDVSPKGKYFVWYDLENRQYYSHDMSTGEELCMTEGLSVNFWNEKHDTPSLPRPYGVATWMENDEAILVYDQFDIWSLDPKGKKKAENITKGEGRISNITLRYIKTDPESRFIGKKEQILLSAFNNTTKERGFYKINKKKVQPLVTDKYQFAVVQKAKDANKYLFTKGNFNTSIDLYVTNDEWKTEKKLSDINPQMRDYNWGTAELMSWTTFDGKETQGIVYKPENFDPNKKYPVMIYFYEQVSDGLYDYKAPVPSRSIINIPFFCSRGYVVFTPDIQYTDGHPGESAYNSIVAGAEELAKNSWIDKDNMAIQGQSWGGYQVAYLVTRTNMFKAAGAGAPVSNMISAYGGIRWGTGNSRQYQYEHGQSRIGATIWDVPDLYVENSPIYHLPKIETPLLIMHNDKDEAVPWYQGIEMFMGMRRLGKPVWMLQYNNEAHNLKERRNAKDLSIRLQQFFDHYLKGDPMPKWMSEGVPATRKGQDYGFEF